MKIDPKIFKLIVALTIASGLVALLIAFLPSVFGPMEPNPYIDKVFNTAIFTFGAGVVAVFGMLGSGKVE